MNAGIAMSNAKPRFERGTRFYTSGKHKKLCTVNDIWITTSWVTGETVKIRYVATHDFCGQVVTDCDVVDATIARGLVT